VLHLKKDGTGATIGTGGAAGNDSAAPSTASALVVSCAASSARCVDAAERARTGAVERPPELLRHAPSPSRRPWRASPAMRDVTAGRKARFVFALRDHRSDKRWVAQPLELLARNQRAGVSAPKRSRRSRRA